MSKNIFSSAYIILSSGLRMISKQPGLVFFKKNWNNKIASRIYLAMALHTILASSSFFSISSLFSSIWTTTTGASLIQSIPYFQGNLSKLKPSFGNECEPKKNFSYLGF